MCRAGDERPHKAHPKQGVGSASRREPRARCPAINASVFLHWRVLHDFHCSEFALLRRLPDCRQRAINDFSTGIVTTMGAIAGYSNGTDTQDEFVVLDAW